MAKLFIDNFQRGLIKNYGGALNASQRGRQGEYQRTSGIDLFRQGFEGMPTPAQIFNTSTITGANFTSHIRAAVADPVTADHVYLLLGGLDGVAPRIERLVTGAYSTTGSRVIAADAGDDFTPLPSGTGFWGEDIILYNVSGTNRIFYSWNDSDDGDVGTGTLAGTPTYDDDYMSTVATGGVKLQGNVPHRMIEGPDRNLWITNGRYVSRYDGSTATFTQAAYDAGPGWITTDVRVWRSLLVISSINTGASYLLRNSLSRSRVCIWNTTDPGLGTVYEISAGHISAVFIGPDGSLYAFTSKVGDLGQLRRLEGGEFLIKKEWQQALYGTIPQPNSVDNYRGLICWVPGDSLSTFVLAYDPVFDALHVPFIAFDGTNATTSMGILKNIDANNLWVGILFGSTYELANLNGSSGYGSVARDLRTRLYELPYNSTIKAFRFYFSQLAASAQAQFSFFANYNTLSIGGSDDLLNLTLDNTTYGAISEYELARTMPNISSFYMNLRLTGQVSVRAIEIEYSPSR